MKMIKITKCSDEKKWYVGKVGQLFPLLDDDYSQYEYKTFQDKGLNENHRFINFVSRQDAIIVEVPNE